jgi:hypothetical protein
MSRDKRDQAKCRVCGCTEADCSGCFERTARPCYWVELDLKRGVGLCSACASTEQKSVSAKRFRDAVHARQRRAS